MNLEAFNTLGKDRSTVLVKKVGDAISKDIKAQRRRVSRSKYNRWIHAEYKLSNANALRYGHAIGNKILKNEPLAKGDSYIKGSDLAKIVYYSLHNEGRQIWHHLRTLIEREAKELEELLTVSPIATSSIEKTVTSTIANLDFNLPGVTAELRRLADKIEPLEGVNNGKGC